MASREAMNMGSRGSSTVISELRSVISLLGQTADSAYQKVASSAAKMYSSGGAAASTNLVAPNPVFSSAPPITSVVQTGSGLVAAGPSGAGAVAGGGTTNLTNYVSQYGGGSLYSPEAGGGGGGFGRGSGGSGTSGTAGDPNSTSRVSNALGTIGKAVGAVFGAYNIAADMMPSTSDILEGQLLQKRASYFSGTSMAATTANQNKIANLAMLSGDNPQLDVLRAQIAAQSYGLGSSANNLLTSAANVSNLMPGIGVEGAMRATGAMQQASSVNMLRGIGIQLRNPVTGRLSGPDEVIDQVWQKICRDYGQAYGAGKSPSLNEVQISLQPGNALDSMLNQYFGGDPMLKQLVANGLIFKAKATAAGTSDVISKEALKAQGATTDAMTSFTETAAAGQAMITDNIMVSGASAGFETANKYIRAYYNTTISELGKSAMALKSAVDTLLTAFNGNLFSLIGSTVPTLSSFLFNSLGKLLPGGTGGDNSLTDQISSFFKNPDYLKILLGVLPGMASGGPVSASSPYIVGEKGPELFVPSSNGTIVSNDKLTSGTYTYNFTINAASGNTQDLVAEIKSVLIQLETNRKVSES